MKINLSLSAKQNKVTLESEILIRFVANRTTVFRVKSGIFINPDDWSETKGELKTISKIASREKQVRLQNASKQIKDLTTTIADAYTNTPKEFISKEWLNKVIHDFHFPPVEEEPFFSFYDAFELFLSEIKKHKSIGTYKKFKTVKGHLYNYNPKLTFSDIDGKFFSKYIDYMQTSTAEKGAVYRNSTMAKNIGLIKWFLSWATDKGYNENRSYEVCRPRFKQPAKVVIYLDKEELESVKTHDFSKDPRLDKVRDVFVFCCYSGLRYSDVENLKRSNIYDDKLHITTIKTADTVTINLNDVTRAILAKYADYKFDGDKALPVISNQKMNDALKDMAKACELNREVATTYFVGSERFEEAHPKHELITTHAGRRTFICTALSLGIAPQVVMKWTGHSDYKAMKPYIDITEKAKQDAMDLFNK